MNVNHLHVIIGEVAEQNFLLRGAIAERDEKIRKLEIALAEKKKAEPAA